MPSNQCDGCQRGLPVHIGMHIGEQEMFMCTAGRYSLELEPMTDAPFHKPKRKPAPFTFDGGTK